MKYAYTIIYVSDVTQTIEFYEKAFRFIRKFVTPENDYGTLSSGETTIALGNSNFKKGLKKITKTKKPFGVELAFTTENIEIDFKNAINAGRIEFEPITEKP